jgi:hypothetical protein
VQFLFQQRADSLGPGDLLVRPDVQGFTSLNFSSLNIERLIGRGVAAADSVLPRDHCRGAAPTGVVRQAWCVPCPSALPASA